MTRSGPRRPGRTVSTRALALGGLAALATALLGSAHAPAGVMDLHVTYPAAESVVDPEEPALLAGNAFLEIGLGQGLDAVAAVDVSTSTEIYAGADVDGDGVEERLPAVGDDSVLAAEVRAAKRVVGELAGSGHRVALVLFSGRARGRRTVEPPASLLHPLSSDREVLLRALGKVPRPGGQTDIAAALDTSLAVLGPERSGRERVILLFTDGTPTLPHEKPAANLRAVLDAAQRCAGAGVRVHTFAIGSLALANPAALIRIAEETGGLFMAVETSVELADVAAWVARASVQQVRVRNRTTGAEAQRVHMAHDGSWSALVGLQEGRNRIEITATAVGGAEARRELLIVGRTGAGPQPIPEELGEHRLLLLTDRLARARKKVLELSEELRRRMNERMERARRARARKELELEIDAERRQAR